MIVQTFSLDDLLDGDEEGVPDPLADYRKLSYREQLEDLQRKHHDRERELVSQITDLLEDSLHLKPDPRIRHFLDDFTDARETLLTHFDKEEQIVFPLMYIHLTYDSETIKEVDALTSEHREQEKKMDSLKSRMHLFETPDWNLLRELLEELFTDLSVHISKEDDITFPNYIDLVTRK